MGKWTNCIISKCNRGRWPVAIHVFFFLIIKVECRQCLYVWYQKTKASNNPKPSPNKSPPLIDNQRTGHCTEWLYKSYESLNGKKSEEGEWRGGIGEAARGNDKADVLHERRTMSDSERKKEGMEVENMRNVQLTERKWEVLLMDELWMMSYPKI